MHRVHAPLDGFCNQTGRAEFETPFEFPHVEGVLVWGDPAVGGVTVQQINAAFSQPKGLKALMQRVVAAKCDCAQFDILVRWSFPFPQRLFSS